MLKSNKLMRGEMSGSSRGKLANLNQRLRVSKKPVSHEQPYRNRKLKNKRSPQRDIYSIDEEPINGYNTSFISKEPYNNHHNKTRKLISRAKQRDKSEKKYLAHSQKVMPEEERDPAEDYHQNIAVTEYKIRPYTTAKGDRTVFSASAGYESNDRCISRKQKLRGFKNQNSSTGNDSQHIIQTGVSKGGYFPSDRLSSVDTFKSK